MTFLIVAQSEPVADDPSIAWFVFQGVVLVLAVLGAMSGFRELRRWLKPNSEDQFLSALVNEKAKLQGIDEMLERQQDLKEQLQREIPRLARQTVVEDQLSDLEASITGQYVRYKELAEELKSLRDTSSKLDPVLRDSIANVIQPRYQQDLKRDRWIRLGIVVIVALLVLPYPYNVNGLVEAYVWTFWFADSDDIGPMAVLGYSALAAGVLTSVPLIYVRARGWLLAWAEEFKTYPSRLVTVGRWLGVAFAFAVLLFLLFVSLLLWSDTSRWSNGPHAHGYFFLFLQLGTAAMAAFFLALAWHSIKHERDENRDVEKQPVRP